MGEAVDGVEGIEKAKELKPDLILADLEMPKLDRIGMIKEIRGYNLGSNVNAKYTQEAI